MDLDIRKMVGKAHCYADNYLADNTSKWYALRKAYADGYKEAFNDIQKRASAKSSHDEHGLNKHDVSGSVCVKHQWHFFRQNGIRQCQVCGKMENY